MPSFREQLAARIAARQAARRPAMVPVGDSYAVRAASAREAVGIAQRLAMGDGRPDSALLHVERISTGLWEVSLRVGWMEDDDR